MGNHVLQECRTAQSGQVKETWRNQEGQGALISERGKEKGVAFYGLGSVQKIPTRSRVILDFWAIHLKSTTAALVDALKTCRVKLLAVPVISNEWCVFSGVTKCFFLASDCGCTRCRTVSWGAKSWRTLGRNDLCFGGCCFPCLRSEETFLQTSGRQVLHRVLDCPASVVL